MKDPKSIKARDPVLVPKPALKPKPASASSDGIAFSDGPMLEWKLINDGRGMRVDIIGDMDATLRKQWKTLLVETASNDIKKIEFNMTDASSVSLAGLGMLLLLRERKGSSKDAISLLNCTPKVMELLSWCGMEKYFTVVPVHKR